MQFNYFLIRDDAPMFRHTGLRIMVPMLKEAVSRLIVLKELRWVGFSHFEVDECGSLNDWQGVAPHAQVVCSEIGAMVNMDDCAKALQELDGIMREELGPSQQLHQ